MKLTTKEKEELTNYNDFTQIIYSLAIIIFLGLSITLLSFLFSDINSFLEYIGILIIFVFFLVLFFLIQHGLINFFAPFRIKYLKMKKEFKGDKL